MNKKITLIFIIILMTSSCSSERPKNIGLQSNKLQMCVDKKNCVSSTNNTSDSNYIEPIKMIEPLEVAKEKISKIILKNKSAKIIKLNPTYIYAEYTSSIFKFVDDVEFFLSEKDKQIYIRSASRVGHSDFGVNKKRIEEIRFKYHQNDVN